MSEKIEGTMILEGLVEGPLPPVGEAQEKLERWARGFAGGAVRVNLQVDGGAGGAAGGGHFSALPSNEPVLVKDVAKDGGEPSFVVAESLSDLLRMYPPPERTKLFSTVRSVEYRANLEVQTIYAVGPDGRAATRQQSVACATVKQAEPLSRKETLKRGALGLLVAAAILGISALWVPYPAIWRQLTARVEPATARVELGGFAPYLTVEVIGLDRRNGTLLLKLTRTGAYPLDEAALDSLYANPPDTVVPAAAGPATTATTATTAAATKTATTALGTTSAPATKPAVPLGLLRRRVAVESLAKGVVWLEYHDMQGRTIGEALLRVDGLERGKEIQAAVPAPVVDQRAVVPASVEVMAR